MPHHVTAHRHIDGIYQPYQEVVRRADVEVGLAPARADDLIARWAEIKPWPETPEILRRLWQRRLAIVTNCSQRLAEMAATKSAAPMRHSERRDAKSGLEITQEFCTKRCR